MSGPGPAVQTVVSLPGWIWILGICVYCSFGGHVQYDATIEVFLHVGMPYAKISFSLADGAQ